MNDQSELLRTDPTVNPIKRPKRGGRRPGRLRRVPERDIIYVGPTRAPEGGVPIAERPMAANAVPRVAALPEYA